MIGYDKERLDNLYHYETLSEWHENQWINPETFEQLSSYLNPRYKEAQIFIRSGIFILTIIVIQSIIGFTGLLISSNMTEHRWGYYTFIFSIILFVFNQKILIEERKLFRSGGDEAVLYTAILLLYASFFLISEKWFDSNLVVGLFSLFILGVCGYIYKDRLLSCLALLAGYWSLFFLFYDISAALASAIPFLFMAISAGIYLYSKKLQRTTTSPFIEELSMLFTWISLGMFYLSGNYFIIDQLNKELLGDGENPLWWLFYFTTIAIPLAFVILGIRNKSLPFLTIGLLSAAISIVSIKYYHNLMPYEWGLILGGIGLLTLAYIISRLLKEDRGGFTLKADKNIIKTEYIDAIIALQNTTGDSKFKGQGGSFGGGGASGGF